jgi:hypothetical protein
VLPTKPSPRGASVKLHAADTSRSLKRPASGDSDVTVASKWGMYVK